MFKKIAGWIVVLAVVLFAYMYLTNNTDDTNMNIALKIAGKLNSRNELVDYDNEIGVNGLEDIAYTVKDGKLYLYFGKTTLELKGSDLANQELIDILQKIGIEIKKTKEGRFKVTYHGEDVQRWVK